MYVCVEGGWNDQNLDSEKIISEKQCKEKQGYDTKEAITEIEDYNVCMCTCVFAGDVNDGKYRYEVLRR